MCFSDLDYNTSDSPSRHRAVETTTSDFLQTSPPHGWGRSRWGCVCRRTGLAVVMCRKDQPWGGQEKGFPELNVFIWPREKRWGREALTDKDAGTKWVLNHSVTPLQWCRHVKRACFSVFFFPSSGIVRSETTLPCFLSYKPFGNKRSHWFVWRAPLHRG